MTKTILLQVAGDYLRALWEKTVAEVPEIVTEGITFDDFLDEICFEWVDN